MCAKRTKSAVTSSKCRFVSLTVTSGLCRSADDLSARLDFALADPVVQENSNSLNHLVGKREKHCRRRPRTRDWNRSWVSRDELPPSRAVQPESGGAAISHPGTIRSSSDSRGEVNELFVRQRRSFERQPRIVLGNQVSKGCATPAMGCTPLPWRSPSGFGRAAPIFLVRSRRVDVGVSDNGVLASA
jgi:hypothetical protein